MTTRATQRPRLDFLPESRTARITANAACTCASEFPFTYDLMGLGAFHSVRPRRETTSMTSFVLRHKTLTLCVWLLLALCGAKYAGTMMHRMDYTYTTPGQPGFIANQHILDSFRVDGTFEPFLAVLHLPQGSGMDTPAGQAIAAKTFDSAENAGIVAVADYANTHNPVFILDHGQTTWALINLPNPDKGPGAGIEGRVDPAMQQAVAPGSQLTLTGFAQMLSNAEPNRHSLIVGLEFGIVAAAIVLLM